ncbi:MAG TPA: hypothetical protein VGK29_26800 [Paludibaculum sp.]|jgi:hypothetical protein
MRIVSLEDRTCTWRVPGGGAVFTMQAGLVNQLKAKVAEGLLALPKRGMEVGGVLLGRVLNRDPLEVQITAFEPVPCEHRFGPTFILSDNDLAGLDSLLAELTSRDDAAIVGYFRSCTGREQALDDADLELLRTRFPGPESIVLSIKPLSLRDCQAWFFLPQSGTMPTIPSHPAMPFDDRQTLETPEARPAETPALGSLVPVEETPPPPEPQAVESPAPLPHASVALAPAPERQAVQMPAQQSLAPVEETPPPPETRAAESAAPLSLVPVPEAPPPLPPKPEAVESPALHDRPAWHWVALVLMLSVATIAGYDYGSSTRQPEPPPPAPKIIAPRIEAPPAVVPPPAPPKPARPLPPVVPAALIQRAAPELPDGIRARIEVPVVVHVDVSVDARGKVTKAVVRGEGDGLFRFLSERAVIAAQASTFRPARDANGTPVPSTVLLPFVFESPRQ